MLIGGLSFLIPLGWQIAVSLRRRPSTPATAVAWRSTATAAKEGRRRSKKKRSRSKQCAKQGGQTSRRPPTRGTGSGGRAGGSVPFRLLLFAAFSFLSLQATRNSHQFAAVVGAVTAWNFGEWAAAIRQRRRCARPVEPSRWALPARPLAFAAVAVLVLWVGSGQFFRMTGEGRTIGFGEDALWFPHQAAKFAGQSGNAQPFSLLSQRPRGAL